MKSPFRKKKNAITALEITNERLKIVQAQRFANEKKINKIKNLYDGFIREVGLNLDEIFEAYVIGNRGEIAMKNQQ